MHKGHFEDRANSQQMSHQFLSSGNPLGIGNTNFIWDRKRKHLVILTEANQLNGREINAIINGNRLILEAPLTWSYDKPFRLHLNGREATDEFEDGLAEIGFSEIRLKPGYHYSLLSCSVMNSNMIKVLLDFRPEGRRANN